MLTKVISTTMPVNARVNLAVLRAELRNQLSQHQQSSSAAQVHDAHQADAQVDTPVDAQDSVSVLFQLVENYLALWDLDSPIGSKNTNTQTPPGEVCTSDPLEQLTFNRIWLTPAEGVGLRRPECLLFWQKTRESLNQIWGPPPGPAINWKELLARIAQ